jgi:hypothetical protein
MRRGVVCIALLAVAAALGVALITHAGDAACASRVHYYRILPDMPYEMRFAPCEAVAGGNVWEVAAWP